MIKRYFPPIDENEGFFCEMNEEEDGDFVEYRELIKILEEAERSSYSKQDMVMKIQMELGYGLFK